MMDRRDIRRPLCSRCTQLHRCVPAELQLNALSRFEGSVIQLPLLRKGEALVRPHETHVGYYALRCGMLKSLWRSANGAERIDSLYLPGAVFASNQQYEMAYAGMYVALTNCTICRIPKDVLTKSLLGRQAALAAYTLGYEYDFLLQVALREPSQRVALMLLRMAHAWQTRRFDVPIDSGDIASYLSIRPDEFREGLLELIAYSWIWKNGDEVEIRDTRAMRRYVEA